MNKCTSAYTALTGPFTGSDGSELTDTQLANIVALFEMSAGMFEAISSTGDTNLNGKKSAGPQLAMWEAIYETGPDFRLDLGNFQAKHRGARNHAHPFLGNMTKERQADYPLTFLHNDSGVQQDLVSIKRLPDPIAAVPLPAAGLLLLGALVRLTRD